MERGRDNGWLLNEKSGELVGINLGAEYTSGHEWGIKGLKRILGVSTTNQEDKEDGVDYGGVYGIDRRRCKNPIKDCIALKEDGDTLNLIVTNLSNLKWLMEHPLDDRTKSGNHEWAFYDKDEMVTAWNENGLLIRVKGEKNFKKLRQLYDALLDGGCAIWLGGGGVFRNAGLCLAIINKVPEDDRKVMHDADVDHEKLSAAVEKTGIKKKLKEANEHWRQMMEVETGRHCWENKWGYYALSPRWLFPGEKKKTKHPVIFFLNPCEQDKNNYGWFTVEELEAWLEGKGPIPMSEKEKKEARMRS